MAIPSSTLSHIYEARDGIEETDSILTGMLGTNRMMKVAVLQQKAVLIEKREKMVADVGAGHILPHATQRERLRLFQLISMYIYWLEQNEVMLDNAISILSSPPGRIRQQSDDELTTDDEI